MREMRETMTRVMTGKLIDMADDGVIPWESVAMACLNYMSEADVADMARCEFDMTDDEDHGECHGCGSEPTHWPVGSPHGYCCRCSECDCNDEADDDDDEADDDENSDPTEWDNSHRCGSCGIAGGDVHDGLCYDCSLIPETERPVSERL